jgi:PAS domain S-box-containing protein
MTASRRWSRTTGLIAGVLWLLTAWVPAVAAPVVAPPDRDVVIGVLAFRGEENALSRWTPTAAYLSTRIPECRFEVRPYTLRGLREAVASGEVDFVLTNPGDYVELEAAYGITRLVTLRNLRDGHPYTVFGAVIITRADRRDIRTLSDLHGKSFMAVSRSAFGGFQLAWREMKAAGVDPFSDLSRLVFAGFPQDDIVFAVRDGEVDAGTVRTDILERLAKEGKIRLSDFRVLNAQTTVGFPFRHSTRLYPEWPFARTEQTPDRLAQRVAVALLTMPEDHPAAVAGRYAGWTVPLDYHRVHELFQELGIGPYHHELTLALLWSTYWHWLVVGTLLMLTMAAVTAHVLKLNRKLDQTNRSLEEEFRERRRAEAQMRKLSTALEQSADLVMITDREGVIEYVNPAFERTTGYSRAECIGQKPSILKSGQLSGETYRHMWSTILDGEVFTDVFVNRRKDGSLYYEEKSIAPLKNEQQEVTYFVSTGKDITDRVRTEERAREHEAQIAHASRVSTAGELATALAHELNQPLAAIVNYAKGGIRRLRSGASQPDQLQNALDAIAQQGERSGEIIRRLRRFLSKRDLKYLSTDINQVVREAVQLASLDARQKRVRLETHLAPGLPPVTGDSIQLEQVVVNLVRNSIDALAGKPDGLVTVATRLSASGEVEVSVDDTGPGLPPGGVDHLFDAFFTTKAEGMGMGLSISRSIITAHGGRLTASDRQNGGAHFSFTLPTAPGEKIA